MQPRDASLDLVRVAALLAIVAGHVWSGPTISVLLYTWHVPVFFFISGWLWKQRSVKDEFQRRNVTLLKPYLFWLSSLVVLVLSVGALQGRVSFGSIAGGIYGGGIAAQPFTTLWFVFVLYASTIIYRFIASAPILARVSIIFAGLVLGFYLGPILARTPLALGSAFPALTFLAAGVLAGHATNRYRLSSWFGVPLLVLGALIFTAGAQPFNLKAGDWGTPITSAIATVLICWGFTLAARLVVAPLGFAGRWVTEFAVLGFTVVLAHPAVIWLLGSFLPQWVVFVLAVVIPSVLAAIARGTRLSPWVTGIPRRVAKEVR